MNGLPTGQTFLFTLALVAIVVVRFLLRELRVRRMATNRLFVLPAIFALLVVFFFVLTLQQDPAQVFALTVGSLAAVVAGGGIGLAVAHFTSVKVASERGVVFVRGSAATVAIWIGALLLRLVPRYILVTSQHTPGTTLMLNAVLLVMLTVAIFTVRLQILRRARLEPVGQSA
jgi:hypothetical protein